MVDTSDIKNADDTAGVDNNSDCKNAYAKLDFGTYNIAGANVGADASDAIITGEEVRSNTNNIDIAQSSKVGGADKGRASEANKNEVGGVKKGGCGQK